MNRCCMLVGGLVLAALVAVGEDLYWDTNGATPGFGAASGTWGTSAYWSADPTGASETSARATTGADALWFGTASIPLGGGTISVDAPQALCLGRAFPVTGSALCFQGDGGIVFCEPERVTYQGEDNATFLKKGADTVVFKGLDLSKCTPTDAYFNKGGRSGAWASGEASIHFVIWNDVTQTMTFQCQRQSGQFWVCQKIQLKQSGDDVVGQVLYNRYKTASGMVGNDYDPVTGYTEVSVCTLKADGTLSDGYLIDQIKMVETESGWTVDGGARVVFDTPVEVRGDFNVSGSVTAEYKGDSAATSMRENADIVVFENLDLSLYDPGSAWFNKMGRANSWASGHANVYHLVRSADGGEMTFQCQVAGSQNIMCVKVKLTQSGKDVLGRVVYARYISVNKASAGFDFDTQTGWTKADVAVVDATDNTRFSKGGYLVDWLEMIRVSKKGQNGVSEFRRALTVAKSTYIDSLQEVCLLDENALTVDGELNSVVVNNGRLVFGAPCPNTVISAPVSGSGALWFTNRLAHVSVAVPNALGCAETVVDGSTMSIDLSNGTYDGTGALVAGKVLRVANGGRLVLNGNYCINRKDGSGFELDASTAECWKSGYFNRVALKNGSAVEGPIKLSVGLTDGSWTVGGTSPSVINADLEIVGEKWVGVAWPVVTFDVADVTGDGAADLVVNGCLMRFKADDNHLGVFFDKRGDGTMKIMRTDFPELTYRLYAGTLSLGSNDVLAATSNLRLLGGSLAVAPGVRTSAGSVTLGASCSLEIGDGARLAFEDASALSWTAGKTLTVKGTLGRRTLRFGTSAAGLTADQLAAIRDEGGAPCKIDANGYVRSTKSPGFAVLLK